MIIRSFDDFTKALLDTGFTSGASSKDDVVCLCRYFDESVEWHTDSPETDPWEWRMRVLNERDDIAYGKLFFKKSGYITKEWYPWFLAVRRGDKILNEEYQDGTVSIYAKRIYEIIEENEPQPLHKIKELGGFTKEDKSKFDSAITDLQMRMYLTMCGGKRKTSLEGMEYGWTSTVFCRTEDFFGTETFHKGLSVTREDAIQKLKARILELNPEAQEKKLMQFITG